MDEQLADARTADDFIAGLVASLDDLVRNDPGFVGLIFELFTLSRRNEEIAAEFAELLRRQRERLSELLRAKQAEGVLHLRAEPEAVVDVLFALGDGVALRMLAEPERDFSATVAAGVAVLADAARRRGVRRLAGRPAGRLGQSRSRRVGRPRRSAGRGGCPTAGGQDGVLRDYWL